MINRLIHRSSGWSGMVLIVVAVISFVLVSKPAYSETAIYAWQDESGSISYTNDQTNAPSDAQKKVFSQSDGQDAVAEPESTQVVAPPAAEPLPRTVTQGEFAVGLVEELGLADEPTEEEAADLLTSARISPKLGEWELDRPMSPELTLRLRKLTVAAADKGRITLTPDQGLLAFDTAAALVGLTIPVTPAMEETSEEEITGQGTTREETSTNVVYPVAETPPLVYVQMPPPEIYPYYVWNPVPGGFWWNGFAAPGFFVLDVNIFFTNHHHRPLGNHHAWDSGHIERRFRSHIVDHRIRELPPARGRERVVRPGDHRPLSDRTVALPKNSNPDFRHSGSHPSNARREKHFIPPQQSQTAEIPQQPTSGRQDRAMPTGPSGRYTGPSGRYKVKSDPSRYADSVPADRRSPSGKYTSPSGRYTGPSGRSMDESAHGVRSLPPRPVGVAPEADRRPSTRSDSSSGRSGRYDTRPTPPPNLSNRTTGDRVVVPKQPPPLMGPSGSNMDQRFMPRPQPVVIENAAGRGPAGPSGR